MEFDDNLNPVEPTPPTPPTQPTPPTSDWSAPVAPTPRPLRGASFGMLFLGGAVLVLLAAGAVYFATRGSGTKYDNGVSGQQEGLNVSAEGLVYATPDIAKLNTGVSEIGRDATTVQNSLSQKIDAIKTKLKEIGIEDKDIKTAEFGIYPDYGAYPVTSTSRPRSYTGRHMLEITIRDLDKADEVADGVVSAGANEVQNVYFTMEDSDSWYQQARSQAIEKAKQKATQLAEDADIRLGKLLSISESGQGGPIYYDRAVPGYGGTGGAEIKTGLEPGNLEIRAYVTLVYQIR